MSKRLVLLVGLSDFDETFVIGAWEEGILDIMDAEEVQRIMDALKEQWYPNGQEWREVIIEVPEASLLALFAKPDPITAKVVT